MTRWCSSNWSMPCQRCVAVAVGLGAGRTSCMPTRAMTSRVAALICASLALRGVLPGVASSAMTGSGVIAGWLSAHTPGWQPSASCVLASNAGSIFTSRCFLWLAASSAFAISHRFVSHSKRCVKSTTPASLSATHPSTSCMSLMCDKRALNQAFATSLSVSIAGVSIDSVCVRAKM